MIDQWFGQLLRAIDAAGLAGTTGVVLCTDHGHYLGERGMWGKDHLVRLWPVETKSAKAFEEVIRSA